MKIEEVKPFIDYAKKKGILSGNTLNTWSGAITAVSNVLGEEEKTIDYVLDNSDVIKNRLQNQSIDMSGNTIALYVQRSQLALKNFLEWKKDRAGWEKKQAAKPKADNTKQSKNISSKLSSSEQPQAYDKKIIPVPTASGDAFEIKLPKNYVMSDLIRVAWALAVYAEDFDPMAAYKTYGKPPQSTNLVTIVKEDEADDV